MTTAIVGEVGKPAIVNHFATIRWNKYEWLQLPLDPLFGAGIGRSDPGRHRRWHTGGAVESAGSYQTTERAIYWNGHNVSGELVSSSIYLDRLQAAPEVSGGRLQLPPQNGDLEAVSSLIRLH